MSKRLGGYRGYKTKPLHGISSGSSLVVAQGQQYNIGEKPTVILYTDIDRLAERLKQRTTQKTSYSVVMSYTNVLSLRSGLYIGTLGYSVSFIQ